MDVLKPLDSGVSRPGRAGGRGTGRVRTRSVNTAKGRKWATIFLVFAACLLLAAAILLFFAREGYRTRMRELEEIAQKTYIPVDESAPAQDQEVDTSSQEGVTSQAQEETQGTQPAASTFNGEIVREAKQNEPANNRFFRISVANTEKKQELGKSRTLEASDTFLTLRLQIENISGTHQTLIPLAELFLEDPEGHAYSVAFLNEGDLQENLDQELSFQASEKKEGTLAFDIPADATNLKLTYRPANGAEEDTTRIGPLNTN